MEPTQNEHSYEAFIAGLKVYDKVGKKMLALWVSEFMEEKDGLLLASDIAKGVNEKLGMNLSIRSVSLACRQLYIDGYLVNTRKPDGNYYARKMVVPTKCKIEATAKKIIKKLQPCGIKTVATQMKKKGIDISDTTLGKKLNGYDWVVKKRTSKMVLVEIMDDMVERKPAEDEHLESIIRKVIEDLQPCHVTIIATQMKINGNDISAETLGRKLATYDWVVKKRTAQGMLNTVKGE